MTTQPIKLGLSWWIELVAWLALIAYACGCAAPQSPIARKLSLNATEQAALVESPVSEMKIVSFVLIDEPPASSFVARELSTGSVIWTTHSNFCRQVRIDYVSPVTCAVLYNTEPQQQWTNYSTGGYSFTPGFVRISGQLPAGNETVVLPMTYGETGFLTLKEF